MSSVTGEQLACARKKLAEMAQNKKDVPKSKADAIVELTKEIEAARTSGYTLEEIAQALTETDIKISAGTLKSYLARGQKSKGGKAKGGIRMENKNDGEGEKRGKSKGSSAADKAAKLDAALNGGGGSDGTFTPQSDSDDL
jgi:hypothetical protein